MYRLTIVFLLCTVLEAKSISIAVAANVSYAINPLINAFNHTHPDTTVRVTIGSSGKLSAQILNGAPFGLLMAANLHYPQTLFEKGAAISAPKVYAKGALALFSVRPLTHDNFQAILADPAIKEIALANPKTAPYGKAAVEAMHTMRNFTTIQTKLIYAESVAQALFYALHSSDVAFIAKSALYSPKLKRFKQNRHWITVSPSRYAPILQGVVLLQPSKNRPEYRTFYDFLLSDEAQQILQAYGYEKP